MTSFNERAKSFEGKYAHEADLHFRAVARRNRMLGLWAAELLGKTGNEANEYSREVVKADFRENGEEDVLRKVAEDLGGLSDETTVRAKMHELFSRARAQIMEEL